MNAAQGRFQERDLSGNRRALLLILAGALLLMISCQPDQETRPSLPGPSREALGSEQVLALGDISANPATRIEAFQPLADHLAARCADLGIKRGQVVIAPDLETMMDYLKSGRVDLYFDSPWPALMAYERIGARPLLRRWKNGVSDYHVLIVASRDSRIADLEGLRGKVVAFDQPWSTSGHVLPKSHLVKMGYQLIERSDPAAPVPPDQIGYIFCVGDQNVIHWVLQRKTAGAALPHTDYEALDPSVRGQLRVLARTVDVPRHMVVARPALDEALQARIVQLLRVLHETPRGRAVLDAFEHTSRFDQLPQGPDGTMRTLQRLFAPTR